MNLLYLKTYLLLGIKFNNLLCLLVYFVCVVIVNSQYIPRSLVPFVPPNSSEALYFRDEIGNIVEAQADRISFYCINRNNYNFDKFIQKSYEYILVSNCDPIENGSYADTFTSMKINVPKLKSLLLMFQIPMTLDEKSFENLMIQNLKIYNRDSNNNFVLKADFMKPLTKLKYLYIINVVLPQLPENTNIVWAHLLNGVSYENFGGCSKLRHLFLVGWDIKTKTNGWLVHCTRLTYMNLREMTTSGLKTALTGVKYVRYLHITYCALAQIPVEVLYDAVDIELLNVSHNKIGAIFENELYWLRSLKNLTTLDLSYNEFNSKLSFVFILGPPLRNLRELDVSSNSLQLVCELISQVKFSSNGTNVRRLIIRDTNLGHMCFDDIRAPFLEYLDLSNSNISSLIVDKLPLTHRNDLVVDLQKNPITDIPFHKLDYELLRNNTNHKLRNTTLKLNMYFDCDCQYGYFARAIREELLQVIGAKCIGKPDRTEMGKIPKEDLECEKTVKDGCTFRTAWDSNTTTAFCDNIDLTRLPSKEGITNINAVNNNIKAIKEEDLTDDLIYLDIRRNSISRLDQPVVKALFNGERRIFLSGNPWICDCLNKYFIEQVQLHQAQVEDYDNMTCSDDGRYFSEVLPDTLCYVFPLTIVLPVGAVLTVCVVAISLLHVYRYEAKLFLFTRGWCLSCVQETDIDVDREYDAFISFSHIDEDFVTELLARLEPEYKICVHYRDWMVGDWIPTQISRSVQLSRRTLLVVSKNYLESTWGMFEFRTALASSRQEGRLRVLAVILDDVLRSTVLEPDLQEFLDNNTYISADDPWFWQRLRFALPHKKVDRNTDRIQNSIELNIQISCHNLEVI